MEASNVVELDLDLGLCEQVIGKHKVVVVNDIDVESPREWDNLGTMWCWHRRYALGDSDDQKPSSDDFYSWDEVEEHIRKTMDIAVLLPLYLYDHSGITMKTTPFGCRWDSGIVGFIFVTKQEARDNWGCKRVTKKYRDMAKEILLGEVDTYDKYITGECYGVELKNEDGDVVESCWGFLGMDHKESGLSAYAQDFLNNVAA